MKSTLKDVARETGVSISTVSRVLSGSPRISAETTARVQDAIRKMGYKPNLLARSLVERSSNIIAAVMPSGAKALFSEPFFFDVLRGIGESAEKEGYHLMLSTGGREGDEEESLLQLVNSGIVGGVILLTSRVTDDLVEELWKMNFPFVVLGHPGRDAEISWVDNDNRAVGYAAAKFLIQRGCKRLAYWDYSPEHSVSLQRKEGVEQAEKECGLKREEQHTVEVDWGNCIPDEAKVQQIFSGNNPPDGILAGDLMAMALIAQLREMKIRVPEDVSVIGFNNTPLGRICQPALTTVDLSPAALGEKTVELLLSAMQETGSAHGHCYVPFEIVERESTRSEDFFR